MPKIYCCIDMDQCCPRFGGAPAFAIAEDGTILAEHFCTNEMWARRDLGLDAGGCDVVAKYKAYCEHKPGEGFELVWVESGDVSTHAVLGPVLAVLRAKRAADSATRCE